MAQSTENKAEREDNYWLSVIGRALAYQCLNAANLHDEGIAERARFLISLGLKRNDIAALLGTTEETVRTTLAKAQKSVRSKNARDKKKSRKE